MSGRPITRTLGRVHVPPGSYPTTGAPGASVAVSGSVYPNGEAVALGWSTTRQNGPNLLPTAVATLVSNAGGGFSGNVNLPAAGTWWLATWPAKFPRDVSFHGPVTVA